MITEELSKRNAVFLDLQGTLGGEGLGDIMGFSFYSFAIQAIRLLNDNKLLAIVVTNQTHIAKGYFTYKQFEEKVEDLNHQLTEQGARFDGVYCCPHRSKDNCSCYKPKPGLLFKAKKDFDLDIKKCYMVGDSGPSDIKLAQTVGARGVQVMTGVGNYCRIKDKQKWEGVKADYMATDVLEAVRWILDKEKRRE